MLGAHLGVASRPEQHQLLGGRFDRVGGAEQFILGDDGRIGGIDPAFAFEDLAESDEIADGLSDGARRRDHGGFGFLRRSLENGVEGLEQLADLQE